MLFWALQKKYDDGSERSGHRLCALMNLNKFYEILYRNSFFLPEEDSEELETCIMYFVLHYMWLTTDALDRGHLLYNFIYKCHMVHHVAANARWLNPRCHWAYRF